MSAKVSVIVPVYNTEKYLRKCMDSLVNQTFQDIEIICFNDASTDGSLSILEEYAACDKRVKLIDSKVNIKQGGGRNAGIRLASSDYIMFVDSDDWVAPKFVESHYKAAIENDADIVIADFIQWTDGEETKFSPMGNISGLDTNNIKNKHLVSGGAIWTAIYKKKLFLDYNLFFPENIFYEDNAIVIPLFLSAKKIIKVNEYLYYYRKHREATTALKNNHSFFDRFETAIMALNHAKRIGKYDDFRNGVNEAFFNLFFKFSILGIYERFRPVPYDKIQYITTEIKQYLTKEELRTFTSKCSKRERLVLKTVGLPRLSFALYKLSGWLSKCLRG